MGEDKIDEFIGKYRFLSNFYPARICLEDRWYPSAEHAYQAAKTIIPEEKTAIQMAQSPGDAKRLGNKATLRPDWDQVKIPYMRYIVWFKFSKNSYLGSKLLETGNAELIEGNNWGDAYWGVCRGKGENNLGKILMEIRSMLVADPPKDDPLDNVFVPGTNNIFVFGSNLSGIHGAGAARTAYTEYGAEWGVGEGITGHSYALPTKDRNIKSLPIDRIEFYVQRFLAFAKENKNLNFFVTRIGCGFAGYDDSQIAPLFSTAPENCQLPPKWRKNV